jgi:cell division protein FtsB
MALALLAAGFLALSITRNAVHNYQLRQDERDLRAELRQLDADREQLAAVHDYLTSDEYIENVARRVLGLVRPGETLVVVSGSAPTDAGTAPAPGHSLALPWWKDLFIAPEPAATPPPGEAAPTAP